MAEAFALVGLVASIVQFVDSSSRVVHRLHEFQSSINDVPKIFSDITIRLPLLANTLEQTKQADGARLSEKTAKALIPVVDGCHKLLMELDKILNKYRPKEGDSSWRKRLKALSSLAHDTDVQNINTALGDHIQTLTYYTSTASNQVLQAVLEQRKLGSDPPPRKPIFMLKFDQDEDFVGREDIMKEIEERHRSGKHRVAIAGIGGVGKSRIAIEYCYRFRARQPEAHVFWVHASNRARFQEAYNDIARELALPGHGHENPLQLISRWLNDDTNGSWLLVLDSADDSDTFYHPDPLQQGAPLVNYLPKSSNGSILITTRDMRVGERLANRMASIPVLPLEIEHAQLLLKRKSSPNQEEKNGRDTLWLLETLNYLPLAITQAAAFISENDISVTDYVEMLQTSDSDIMDLLEEDLHDAGRDRDIQNSVFKTWFISFAQITAKKPRAAEVLSLIAVLDRQAIPTELLRNDNERKTDFVTAIGTLKAFSLISEEKSQSVFGVHRLVQLSVQRWLEVRGNLVLWQEKALRVVAEYCPDGNFHNWTTWSNLSAHCQLVLGYNIKTCMHQRAKILANFGSYDKEQGRYKDANDKVTEAFAICKNLLGEDHLDVLTSMCDLSIIYWSQGLAAKAEEMCLDVVKIRKRVLGPEHINTLAATSTLGAIYYLQERYVEAEQLYLQLVDSDERVLGLEHCDTLTALHNLSASLEGQDRLEEAERILAQVVQMRSKVMGLQHSNTLQSMQRLATNLQRQRRWEEAVILELQLIPLRIELLTLEHPDTLFSQFSLALIYGDQGLWNKAAELHFQIYETRKRILGLEHRDTLNSMISLSLIYQNQRKLEAAEELQLQVLHTRKIVLGHEHPESLDCSRNLGVTYIDQRRWEEGESLIANVLEIQKRVLGFDHTDTLATMHSMAYAHLRQKNWQESAELGLQVVEASNRSLGQDDPGTLTSMSNLAETYKGLNRHEDAIDLMKTVAAHMTETLGTQHPYTRRAINNVSEWTRMRDNSVQQEPDSNSKIGTSSTAPEAAADTKEPISPAQDQPLENREPAADVSSERPPSGGQSRKEKIPTFQEEPSEQTVHIPEGPQTLISASDATAEGSAPADKVEPSHEISAPVS